MKKYIPEIGDVVKFKGKEYVLIFIEERETLEHMSYDRTYYFVEEDKIQSLTDYLKKEEFLESCKKIDVKNTQELPKFSKVENKKYNIKLISCFTILKK